MSHGLAWPYPRVLAHRGGGTLAPENTLAALAEGARRGFRGVEFDAMLAADRVPMLMHDETLERTTSGRGAVALADSAQLSRLDAGSWLAPRFAGEPVPRLSQALAFCRAQAIWPNVEIKPSAGSERITGEVVARHVLAAYADIGDTQGPDPRLPLLSSFALDALDTARTAVPQLPRGALFDRVPSDWLAQLQRLDCVSLHTNHRHLDRECARAIKDAGYWLFCYTVNEPERVGELFDWGVDGLCSDRIDLVSPA
jgi:glycerophosphoryl diester phosphodiesterase